jgi:hypothetical protein
MDLQELLMRMESAEKRMADLENKLAELQKKTRSSFKPPTLQESFEYVRGECNKNVKCNWTDKFIYDTCVKFIDFYESKDWKVGKNKMVKWQSSLRNFFRNNAPKVQQSELAEFNKQQAAKFFSGDF